MEMCTAQAAQSWPPVHTLCVALILQLVFQPRAVEAPRNGAAVILLCVVLSCSWLWFSVDSRACLSCCRCPEPHSALDLQEQHSSLKAVISPGHRQPEVARTVPGSLCPGCSCHQSPHAVPSTGSSPSKRGQSAENLGGENVHKLNQVPFFKKKLCKCKNLSLHSQTMIFKAGERVRLDLREHGSEPSRTFG